MTPSKNTAGVTPRLRFPEFRNALPWSAKRLEDICTVNSSNDGLPDSFVYIDLESVEDGRLKAKNRIEKSDAPSRAQRHLRNGDVIFQVVRPYQRNNLFVDFDDGQTYVASTGYAQLRAKDSERFLYQAVHVDSFVESVVAKCTGSNYPSINSSDLAEIQLFAPLDTAEQQKIADCLTSLDEVIAAQGRKVEALKAHKRGLMQQLFPRISETSPRLRFPEFRNAPEHGPTTLGTLVKLSSGGTPSKAEPTYWDGDIPWISASSMHDMTIVDADLRVTGEAIGNGTRIAKKDCILILVRGSMLFKRVPICIAMRDVAFNQDVKALAVARGVAAMFLLYQLVALSPRIPINETGIGAGKIETEVLENLAVWVPGIAEQQRIADCLSSLDTQITIESSQLAALKTHKQGLMQQLFPAPEAAGA